MPTGLVDSPFSLTRATCVIYTRTTTFRVLSENELQCNLQSNAYIIAHFFTFVNTPRNGKTPQGGLPLIVADKSLRGVTRRAGAIRGQLQETHGAELDIEVFVFPATGPA